MPSRGHCLYPSSYRAGGVSQPYALKERRLQCFGDLSKGNHVAPLKRVQGLGFRVQGLGFRVFLGLGFRVWVQGLGFRV